MTVPTSSQVPTRGHSVRSSRRALFAAGLLALAGCSGGEPASAMDSAVGLRFVSIELLDFRFQPSVIEVRQGEAVRLLAINATDLPHELFIGSGTDQDRHQALHRASAPDAQDQLEDGASGIYVPAHGTSQLTYRFERPGELIMACHLVGHFEAGMVGVIRVSPS